MSGQNYWSKIVQGLEPYVPGEQPRLNNLVKLNTNENPYPPSPKAIAAMQQALGDDLRLYPDPNADLLKQTIADYYQLNKNQVFVGNGSDEVLAHVFCGLLKQGKPILFPDITYSFYPVYCGLYEIEYKLISLDDQFKIDFDNYDADNGGIIFPNPNAPTGIALTLDTIKTLLDKNRHSVVVIDEAYVDFGAESAVSLINQYPQLLVIQTLSKSRALAGLRVGYAMGHAHLVEGLERIKNSFNSYPLDRMAIVGASAAIMDKSYFEQSTQTIIQSREQLAEQLQAMGFDVLPSLANFIFIRHPEHNGRVLAQKLREQSIIVRHFDKPRISEFLRITIGTPKQNQALIRALTSIFKG